MTLLKKKEMKTLGTADLQNKLVDLEKELMKQNAQIALGTVPKSPGIVKETKKTIAKIKTILKQREVKEKIAEENKKDDRSLS